MTRVSVCIATYNGRCFLKDQLNSILSEICANDEVVVVDDCSSDDTVDYIKSFNDQRIRIFKNTKNVGVNGTFELALKLCRGEFIFLADQDDVWLPGRVDRMLAALRTCSCDLVTTNFMVFGEVSAQKKIHPLLDLDSGKNIVNIYRILTGTANYYGCAMAFRRNLIRRLLPFPCAIESHDLWIAMVANVGGSNIHQEIPSLARRIHGNNLSVVSRPLLQKLCSRLIFVFHLFVALLRTFLRK